jgi:hypothetical protein
MDLWTAMRTIGRHWLVLLLGLTLTGAAVTGLAMRVEQRYSATGTVIVVAPGGRTNPIDVYSSSSSLAATVATTLGSDDASKADVQAEGGTSEYTLVIDPSLPIITITTTSANPQTAVRSFGLVSQQMNRLLAEQQRAFASPPSTRLQVLAVTTPTSAKVTTYRLVVLGIAGALGVLLVISFTFIAESARERRQRRRQLKKTTATAPVAAATVAHRPAPGPAISRPATSQPAPGKPRSQQEPAPSFAEFLAAQASTDELPRSQPPVAQSSGDEPTVPQASAPASPNGVEVVGRRRRRASTK